MVAVSSPAPVAKPSLVVPANMMRMLLDQTRRNPSGVAAQYKRGDRWLEESWSSMVGRMRRIADGLVAIGVKPGDRVGVVSATRYEYALADGGILGAAAIGVPIYHSNTPAEVQYVAANSGLTVAFVENETHLAKFRQERARIPALRRLVLIEGAVSPSESDWVMTLDELERLGDEEGRRNPDAFDRRVDAIDPEQPACFIYTSGTTGNPKGVVLTHRNWCYEAAAVEKVGIFRSEDSILLFLPLAHSFAKVVEAAWWHLGARLAFAETPEKVVPYCAEIHPSILPAVPRVFEKVFNTVVANGSSEPGIKGTLFRWALAHFDRYVEARQAGRTYGGAGWSLAKALVFKKVEDRLRNERLGGQIRTFVSGGAPLSRKIAYFFDLLNLEVLEGYGLTETSAASCVNPPGGVRIGTVGPAVPGTELRIAADGEILIRGAGVMKGYYEMPDATREAIEPDGWFHTGDIGEIDRDGYLRITDRKKDIIVTAGGKNVAPQNLENALKTEPIISQVMVYGDRRKYLVALVTVQEEHAKKVAQSRGVSFASYADLTQKPEIRAEVQAAFDRLNAHLSSYESIKKFTILDRDFSQETGEMTPTLKVKRKFASQKFQQVLDAMYDEKYD
jgi:long-chain acyl-CoA synthetase